jgi:Spy/CpxP family protein refolding chaperone
MKTYRLMTYTLAAVAGLMLAAQSGLAQGGGGGGGGFGGGRGGGRGGLGPDATEEQRTAYQQYNQELAPLTEKVTAARTELADAVFAEKVDEAAIKAKSAALAKAQEELSIGQAKAFAKVRSKFTPEQITNIKAAAARGGGGGGGGGRRGGGAQ